MQKLIKNDEPVFLAFVRTSNHFAPHGRGKRGKKKWDKKSPSYLAVNIAHDMTEGQKRKINKKPGPKNILLK